MMHTESAARFALWPLPDLGGDAPLTSADGSTIPANEYEKGFAAGYERAKEETTGTVADLLGVLSDGARQYDEMRDRLTSEMQPYAVQLALAIARRVIQREVVVDERLVVDAVKRILETVGEKGAVQIRLHPEDLACSESYRILDEWPSRHEWIADASMERGGCVIESPGRFIDGTMDTVLHDFARRLDNA